MISDTLMRCCAVGLGGAAGSLARYGLSVWGASLDSRVPWATLVANGVGCALMGLVMFFVVEREVLSEGVRLAVAVGLLGGLTTFSTFSYEGLALARQGHWWLAASYVGASVAVGLGGAAFGWFGGRALSAIG